MLTTKFAVRLLRPTFGNDIARLIVNEYLSARDKSLLLLSVISVKPNNALIQLYTECGFLELLQKCPINFNDCELNRTAIREGHLHVLKWFHSNRTSCNWNEIDEWGNFCSTAAASGHLEVLKWLRTNGAPWDWTTCSNAAYNGHLEVIKWARENGAPWNSETCSGAAKGGYLEILKWVREHGAPWDWSVCINAIVKDHLEILQWSITNGYQLAIIDNNSWIFNVYNNRCVQFLRGCEAPP